MSHAFHVPAETLERRVFLSAAPMVAAAAGDAPDLTATIDAHFPAGTLPGSRVKAKVRVLNQGGALTNTTLPLSVYASDTPTLGAGATPFSTVPVKANLKTGKSKNYSLSLTLPGNLPASGYYLIVQVNADNAVVESNIDNNVVASTFLANPAGHYEGSITAPGEDPVPIAFDVAPGVGKKILSSFSGAGSLFSSVNLANVNATLSPSGHYSLKSSGAVDGTVYGNIRFTFSATGQITGDTLSGTINIHAVLEQGGARGGKVSFEVTKVV